MKILKIDPGKKPKVMDIDGGLESMSSLVDGPIEAVYPFDDEVALICNQVGKLRGDFKYNRSLRHPETGEAYTIICGPMFLCGAPVDSEHFTDLTREQIARYKKYYEHPEFFLEISGGVLVMKI